MDNVTLKKKLSAYVSDAGRLRNLNEEILYEVLIAWENWTGPSAEFYRSLGFTYKQMAGVIGKAKKLKRDGYYGNAEFKQVKVESSYVETSASGPGYKKAVREANEHRRSLGLMEIVMAYCNAHPRRGFVLNADDGPSESEFMVAQYREIYRLNTLAKDQSPSSVLEIRQEMRPMFESMYTFAEEQKMRFSSKSGLTGAFNYFTNNYSGLTVFLTNPEIPIDNNCSERSLRSHVVGRKTWYGTHSKEAAEAAAIHMTIIETCKLNHVNPREYYTYAVAQIHAGRAPLTPHKYKLMKDEQAKNSS